MSLPPKIFSLLREAGVLQTTSPVVTPLVGGVSCDIWRVEDGDRIFAVKRALPKLRVQAEWYADVSRNRHEQEYFRYVGKFLPHSVPRILFSSSEADFFVMEFLEAEFTDWKKPLLTGDIEPSVAVTAGRTLGRIHRESWEDAEPARLFDTGRHFHDLRIAPYLLAAAEKHPGLATKIHEEAARLASTRRALVHGDYSPKNLMIAPGRLVVLDAEVAWFGDPAFDVCFLLNHFLLKSLHRPENAAAFLELIPRVLEGYRAELGGEKFLIVSRDSPVLLLCLLLARVDGKSPAEYLTDTAKKDFIRAFARQHLLAAPQDLTTLLSCWHNALPS